MQKGSQFSVIYGAFALLFLILGSSWLVQIDLHGLAQAQSTPPNYAGFLWSDTIGWISMNCSNDWDNNTATPPEERCSGEGGAYGVTVEVNPVTLIGTISGAAWSPNIGLVCFGETCGACSGVSCDGRPEGSPVEARFDMNNLQCAPSSASCTRQVAYVQGYARVETQANESGANLGGWIKLSGTAPGNTPIQVGAWQNESGTTSLSGSGWQQNSDRGGIGWVYFDEGPPGNANCVTNCGGDNDVIVTLPPDQETGCGDGPIACCSNLVDDDRDRSYTTTDEKDLAGALDATTTGVDCQDYDCAGMPNCPSRENQNPDGTPAPAQCFDGVDVDNDLDAWVRGGAPAQGAGVDCSDTDCIGAENPTDSTERCVTVEASNEFNYCTDGIDNDRNNDADCLDSACGSFVACVQSNIIGDGPADGAEDDHPNCEGVCKSSDPADIGQPNYCADNDNDKVCDFADNCGKLGTTLVANENQTDVNANGVGDACDAFLETREGSIYGGGFRAPARPRGSNATFCLLSSGAIENFRSETERCELTLGLRAREFLLLQYGDALALWSQALRARIDYTKLRQTAVQPLPANLSDLGLAANAGKVFYHQGDLVVDQEILWQNGVQNGARTILVDGNITFRAPSHYDPTPLLPGAPLRQLASVAWIAVGDASGTKGNIIIDPAVGGHPSEDMVGAFIASNRISTGQSSEALTIKGLAVARRFNFERTYVSPPALPARGAELIIYDGRTILNPPPGLADLVKALPVSKVVAPQ